MFSSATLLKNAFMYKDTIQTATFILTPNAHASALHNKTGVLGANVTFTPFSELQQ